MLSTPFICCSIGVATDCSIVSASAPVYVACTLISGGTMCGYCAMGSPRDHGAADEHEEDGDDDRRHRSRDEELSHDPFTSSRVESTRSGPGPSPRSGCGGVTCCGGAEGAAGEPFSVSTGGLAIGERRRVRGLRHHRLPRRALSRSPSMTIRSPGLSPSSTTTKAPDVAPSLTARIAILSSAPTIATWSCPWICATARCGTTTACLTSCATRTRRVLAGPQELIGVREQRLHRQRAGRRIDLGTEDGDVSHVRKEAAIREYELQRDRLPPCCAAVRLNSAMREANERYSRFGERCGDPHRVDLRHRRQERGLRLADEVPDARLRDAGDPVDGRGDLGVAEIDERRLELALRGGHLTYRRIPRGDRVVEILLTHRLLRHERGITRDVGAGLLERGLGLRERPLCLKLRAS